MSKYSVGQYVEGKWGDVYVVTKVIQEPTYELKSIESSSSANYAFLESSLKPATISPKYNVGDLVRTGGGKVIREITSLYYQRYTKNFIYRLKGLARVYYDYELVAIYTK